MTKSNTAPNEQVALDIAWSQILPDHCHLSCGQIHHDYPSLTALERASFGNELSNTRLSELKAGRFHAKKALLKLNKTITALPKSKNSPAPAWPDKVLGSITHTSNGKQLSHVAAVVTDSPNVSHIGIDAEYFSSMKPNMWPTFLSDDELTWLLAQPTVLREPLVKKIWCIKEAAIKAFARGDMMTFSIFPNDKESFAKFNLTNQDTQNINITAHAIETNGITLAVVYA